jgi:hypothetical protein
MIKNIIVTFEFDTEADTVSNVKCSVDGVEKKKRVTKKKDDVIEEMASESIITLEETKLSFNNKAVADMELVYEDRVFIKWEQEGKMLFPIIGKDGENGNKLTKTNTIAYKGKQNAVLAEFGNQFTIEPYKENSWKLISSTGLNMSRPMLETIKIVEKVEPILIVEDGDETPIDDLQFTL